jgi:glycosyltransferase involved in cell wall biosynthesis
MIISVGMIAYNATPVIEAAIRSSYPYVDEIIVIDGSAYGPSTDETVKMAQSVGPKVRTISGTYAKSNGSWDEQGQRQAYLDQMKRGENHWCILQDADEVYDLENILKLYYYMATSGPETLLLSHCFIHFWGTLNQIRTGGQWDEPRGVCAFRLTPNMKAVGFDLIGEDSASPLNFEGPPQRQVLLDVFSYHYGHALSRDRLLFKVREAFLAGYFPEWPDETVDSFMEKYGEKIHDQIPEGVKPYTGKHPKTILHLIGSDFQCIQEM